MLKTRTGRQFASAFTFAIILDAGLAYLVAEQIGGNAFWFSFALILAVIWLGPLAFNMKSTIYKALFHYLNRSGVRRNLVHEYRKAELPLLSGTDFNDPADLYFAEVAQDDKLPKAARLFAAQTLGQMALIPVYSWVDSIALHSNLDASLANYFDELRRDGTRPHR